jgi:hypothetical protein
MAEPTKKTVQIGIKRTRPFPPKIIVLTGFKLKLDKVAGLVDIFLELRGQQKGEKVTFDPVLTLTNMDHLKRFVTGVAINPDETVVREDIHTDQSTYSNIVHLSRVGNTGETTFSVFSLSDWVNESRQATRTTGEIISHDVVVVVSSAAAQKKLIIDLVLLLEQLNSETK